MLSARATAGSERRSSRKRPTNSAARCCASAALPPLPKNRSLLPAASALVHAAAARLISPSMSSSARIRFTTCRCASTRARITGSTSALSIDDAPRGKALALEGEVGDDGAHLGQRLGDPVLSLKLAVKEHVPAATGARHLAAERAARARG